MEDDYTTLLIEKALEGTHSKFEFIQSMNDFNMARQLAKALNKLTKGFYKSIRKLQKQDNFENEDIIKLLKKCANFYKVELAITKDMIDEFKVYMEYGHFVDMLLGEIRPEQDLVDFRTCEISIF